MDGGEPDIPIYKVIECMGPTNTRVYTVAVYFRGKRLASSSGHSIQQAEMKAAKAALENSSQLFPQIDYQKRVIAQSIQRQKGTEVESDAKNTHSSKKSQFSKMFDDESNLPKQYRTREDISSDELDMSSSSDCEEESNDMTTKSSNDECPEEGGEDDEPTETKEEQHEADETVAEESVESSKNISADSLSDASIESGEIS